MHRCLQVSDILRCIVDSRESLSGAGFERRILSNSNLLAFALVCKDFLEPALDIRWIQVHEFRHLLKCFPADLWEEIAHESGEWKTFYFIRPLRAYDWERFDFYARRVKSLRMTAVEFLAPTRLYIDSGVLQAMSQSCEALNRPQLHVRNVVNLQWNRTQANLLFFVSSFVGPSLTTLDLSLGEKIPGDHAYKNSYLECGGAFDAMAAKGPNIETLSVTGCLSEDLCERLSAFVCHLHNLRSVDLAQSTLSDAAFCHLGSLPHLKKLRIQIPALDGDRLSEMLSNIPHRPFQILSEVHLKVSRLQHATAIIETFKSVPLRKLQFVFIDRPDSSALQKCFSSLVKHCIPSEMVEVDLTHNASFDGESHGFLDRSTIEPLFELHNLENLYIRTHMSTQRIENALIPELIISWPNLRRLDLATHYGGYWPSRVDLDGLVMFAACHRLYALGLAIDASRIPGNPAVYRPGEGPECTTLRLLSLGRSYIRNAKSVAPVLSLTFPNLTSITAWDVYDDENLAELGQHALWKDCINQYRWFGAIKHQSED